MRSLVLETRLHKTGRLATVQTNLIYIIDLYIVDQIGSSTKRVQIFFKIKNINNEL